MRSIEKMQRQGLAKGIPLAGMLKGMGVDGEDNVITTQPDAEGIMIRQGEDQIYVLREYIEKLIDRLQRKR